MNNTQLLCSFATKKTYVKIVDEIVNKFDILNNKIFVLSFKQDDTSVICTYNINITDGLITNYLDNTVSIHRKKETNTLYSINALNFIIKQINNGILNETIIIPWENYSNSILLLENNELKKIETEIFTIVKLKSKKK